MKSPFRMVYFQGLWSFQGVYLIGFQRTFLRTMLPKTRTPKQGKPNLVLHSQKEMIVERMSGHFKKESILFNEFFWRGWFFSRYNFTRNFVFADWHFTKHDSDWLRWKRTNKVVSQNLLARFIYLGSCLNSVIVDFQLSILTPISRLYNRSCG